MKEHEANRAFWDASAAWWEQKEDERGLWQRAHQDPSSVLSQQERPYVDRVAGKRVCVLGSGDNQVAFALVGLGATVTSVDISQRRLDIAAGRAHSLGLRLDFVRADVTDLAPLADGTFDLVYTGGHMSVWISDIGKYFAEAVRILRPGGRFVVNEYHPMRRMWLDGKDAIPQHAYLRRGPYEYATQEGQPTFEYHWTVADHVQAVIDAGCRLIWLEEYGESLDDEFWMNVDLSKLPAHLLVVGEKEVPGSRQDFRDSGARATADD